MIKLTQLTQVGRIEIGMNPALTMVHGFGTTTIGGDFLLRGNPALTELGAMSSLTTILGALTVDGNTALPDLVGLTGSMQRIYGSVTISNNANLTSLGQLSHLAQIGSSSITNNTKLSYCKALEVDRCVPNSTVTISGNQNASNCQTWCGL
jgi:hypothetical protein